MKQDRLKKQGFMVIMTFFLITLAITLVTSLLVRVATSQRIAWFAADREQAKAVALAGISLVKGSLEHKNTPKGRARINEWFLAHLNAWTTYSLTAEADGIDGELKLYVSCEEGKINLNSFYDQEKKEFAGLDSPYAKKLFARIGDVLKDSALGDAIVGILKKQKDLLNDLSEISRLVNTKDSARVIPLFPEPPEAEDDTQLALSDLLTVSAAHKVVQPLYVSRATSELLELKPLAGSAEERSKVAKELSSKIKESFMWATEWDALFAQRYGKTYGQLDAVWKGVLDPACRVVTVSVICYARVGKALQKLCCILRRHEDHNKKIRYVVKRLYWM